MIFIRSLFFYIYLYLSIPLWTIATFPLIIFSNKLAIKGGYYWCFITIFMLDKIAGVKYKVKGKIPTSAGIIASKHQSAWDTIMLIRLLKNPAYILKRELLYLPFFGFYLFRMGMIFINRQKGIKALKAIAVDATKELNKGRKIVIFPEGTRVKVGQNVKYKRGIVPIYEKSRQKVIPVALNSALHWPKNSFLKKPGTITISFLKPIEPGLATDELMKNIEESIENECKKL